MNGVKILSIDAKDLYIANHLLEPDKNGFNWHNKNGQPNLKKFINTLDYSLDLVKLREVDQKVYRNRKFSWFSGGHEYTDKVINVTFKYSNKAFNKIGSNLYVKFGHRLSNVQLQDCVYIKDNELIAVQTDSPVQNPISPNLLGKTFVYKDGTYKLKCNTTLNGVEELRKDLYTNGFWCNGKHYVRFKRSSGSSRVGKCLFIDEKLYPRMHKWEMTGLKVKPNEPVDLAALEAYIALTLSSIIDTLEIRPYNILVVDDYESIFKDTVVATKIVDNMLTSSEEEIEICNSIWDGLSLIDKSLMGNYSKYGMLLLRKNFFKSCCFNTNIQQFFEDNDITSVSQLNGFTLAQNIEDVKLITTPSSIKYLKFGTIEQWLKNIDNTFGVVKHEKKTHFMDGRMVQTHYQLLNTLQLSKKETKNFLEPTFNYMKLLKTDPAVMRNHLKYPEDHEYNDTNIKTKNEIIFQLLGINDKFTQTKCYQEFQKDLIDSYKANVKCGHVLVEGNYSTLLGNPYELLLHAIDDFNGDSVLGVGNVHSTRFSYNTTLLGSRSPHVCTGNILLTNNVECPLIDKYFNLTDEIVCVNSIKENILQKLSGADFDSDTMLLTDNSLLISAAKKNYHLFKVPTNAISSEQLSKKKRVYTPAQQADLDIKTSENLIGDIINLSQELQTYMWHLLNNGQTYEYIKELYYDICQLDILSGIEIDKAKKEYPINSKVELKRIKQKWIRRDAENKVIRPYFFGFLARTKGYYNDNKNNYMKHDTTMDYLIDLVNQLRMPRTDKKSLKLVDLIVFPDFNPSSIKYDQIYRAMDIIRLFHKSSCAIWIMDNFTTTEQFDQYCVLKKHTLNMLSSLPMSKSTFYWLIKILDESIEIGMRKYAITLLFNLRRQEAFELISKSTSLIGFLQPDKDGEIDIYGEKFSKIYKNRGVSVEF